MTDEAMGCMFCGGTRELSQHEVFDQLLTVCAFCVQTCLRVALDSATPVGRLDSGYQPDAPAAHLGPAECLLCHQPVVRVALAKGSENVLDPDPLPAAQVPAYRRWRLLPGHKATRWAPHTRPERCHIAHEDLCGANPLPPSQRLPTTPEGGYLDEAWAANAQLQKG